MASASNPGRFTLCHKKLRTIRPDLYDLRCIFRNRKFLKITGLTWPEYFADHIDTGDTRAAVVVSIEPNSHFEVAAYTDELDCIAILRFSSKHNYGFNIGDRLLTVNRYSRKTENVDVVRGKWDTGQYTSFHPIIAHFVCANEDQLSRKLASIPEHEWSRAFSLGLEFKERYPFIYRSGRPGYTRMSLFSCEDPPDTELNKGW